MIYLNLMSIFQTHQYTITMHPNEICKYHYNSP